MPAYIYCHRAKVRLPLALPNGKNLYRQKDWIINESEDKLYSSHLCQASAVSIGGSVEFLTRHVRVSTNPSPTKNILRPANIDRKILVSKYCSIFSTLSTSQDPSPTFQPPAAPSVFHFGIPRRPAVRWTADQDGDARVRAELTDGTVC